MSVNASTEAGCHAAESEHGNRHQPANLRDVGNASAIVLRVVPQDASIEVVKQQGAWI